MGIKWSGKIIVIVLAVAALVLGVGADVMLTSAAPVRAPAKAAASALAAAPAGHEIVTGVVTKVAGSEITLHNRQGDVVIVVNSDAWIFVGGKEAGLDAVKTNMWVAAAGIKGADGKVATAFLFARNRPAVRGRGQIFGRIGFGEVVSLNGNTLTVKALNGVQRTVTLTDQTAIVEQSTGNKLTKDALTPGTKVIIRATRGNNNTVQAQRITVLPPNFNPGVHGTQPQGGQQGNNNPRPGFRMGPGRFQGNGLGR